jgi:ABC-2 type transport system permease protein
MNRFARDTTTVTVKELRQLFRDPLSLALTIMFPILLIQLFVVIVTAFSAPSYSIAVVVSDLDGSSVSKSLVDKLTSSRVIKVTQFFQTEEQALGAVESGAATGAVIIPKGFGDALLSNRQAFVILQTDNSKITSSALIQSAVSSSTQSLLELVSARLGPAPVEVMLRPISGRPPTGDTFLPGMLGMITILGAFDDIVNAITRERERGTFPRLVLTPTSILSIYSGKISATVVLNAVRTTLMLVIFVLTGLVIRGNVLLVYLTTTLIAVFTMSLGLMLSTKIRSSATLTILEIAITFPLFQLAGAVQAPELLASGGRALAAMLPWTYGNDAIRRVIYLGVGLDAIFVDLAVLLLSSLVLLPIATLLSKRTM